MKQVENEITKRLGRRNNEMKHLEGRTPGIVDPSPFTRAEVNPVPRTYVRGFGALPLQGGRNIHPVPTVLDRGRIVLSRRSWNGVHPRAYPDPTNKKT